MLRLMGMEVLDAWLRAGCPPLDNPPFAGYTLLSTGRKEA
jgi:hypothetical protein